MISAIVLAAGESRRMGEQNKLLLPYHGKTIIQQFVEIVLESEASEVIVVLGHQADQIQATLQGLNIKFAWNQDYADGMVSSIQTGIQAASLSADGWMICLSDMIHSQTIDLNRLIRKFENSRIPNQPQIVVPTFQNKRGNPVLFSKEFKSNLLQHKGTGCKGIVNKNEDHVIEVIMKNDHLFRDMDTPMDYQTIMETKPDHKKNS